MLRIVQALLTNLPCINIKKALEKISKIPAKARPPFLKCQYQILLKYYILYNN